MAVNKDPKSTASSGDIVITNGDWQALQRVVTAYGVKDEADIIAFAIGILDKSGGRGVIVENTDGSRTRLVPSQKLKAQ